MVRNYFEYHSKHDSFWISPLLYLKDGVDFAMLFPLRESRRTSDPALSRDRGPAIPRDSFTLDVLTLKPSDFCNVGVKSTLLFKNRENH